MTAASLSGSDFIFQPPVAAELSSAPVAKLLAVEFSDPELDDSMGASEVQTNLNDFEDGIGKEALYDSLLVLVESYEEHVLINDFAIHPIDIVSFDMFDFG